MKEGNKIRANGGLSQLDRYLRALNNKRRRYLLQYLDEQGAANVEELARYIAKQESDRPPSALSKGDWKSIQTQLHHQHLPRLEEYGIVDYDERSEDVSLTELSRGFTMLLHLCQFIESHS